MGAMARAGSAARPCRKVYNGLHDPGRLSGAAVQKSVQWAPWPGPAQRRGRGMSDGGRPPLAAGFVNWTAVQLKGGGRQACSVRQHDCFFPPQNRCYAPQAPLAWICGRGDGLLTSLIIPHTNSLPAQRAPPASASRIFTGIPPL